MDTSNASPAFAVPERECTVCKQTKPLTDDFWKTVLSKIGTRRPGGLVCKKCLREQEGKRRKELRRELKIAGHPALQTLPTVKQAAKDPDAAKQRAIVLAARLAVASPNGGLDVTKMSPGKLSTAAALNKGADVIVREAPKVLELLALYAGDPESPHHVWALQLFADRILPQRAFAALAIKEAGLEEKGGSATPRVTINVVTSSGGNPGDGARVIDVEVEKSEPSEGDE